jgi:Ca2+-binding RTX toxin-like protein
MRWTFVRSFFHTIDLKSRRPHRARRHALRGFEQLESRRVLAASAAFNPITGALTVSDSSAAANNIAITYHMVGASTFVLITDAGSTIMSGTVFTSSVRSIVVATGGGNDTVNLGAVGVAQYTQLYQSPVVDSGAGDDTIFGSKLADLLYGVAGNDSIAGLEAADYLYGGDGNDLLYGDYGSNNAPNSGGDTLYGEAGDDLLRGDQGDDALWGFGGADQLVGNSGNDALRGGLGDDTYVFSGSANLGSDTLDEATSAGSDTVTFVGLAQGATFNVAFSNAQTVASGLLTITLSHTDTIDRLLGSAFDDTLASYVTPIYIEGLAGDDYLEGSIGSDTIIGGDGDDFLRPYDGGDTLEGGAGDDILEGENDADVYVFSGSANLGSDIIWDHDLTYDIFDFSDLGAAIDFDTTLMSGTLNSLLTLSFNTLDSEPFDFLEEIIGTAFDDIIVGNSLDNVIRGLAGNDQLFGGDGDDTIYGDGGDDGLSGQSGTDTLDGGSGNNTLMQD